MENEQGIALPLFVVYLVSILLCFALAVDMSHLFITRHKIQMIADAASIAGATMTQVHGTYDAAGNVTGYVSAVDLPAAKNEAEQIIQKNLDQLNLPASGVTILSKTETCPNPSEFYVEIEYSVDTILLGGIDQVTPIQSVTMKAKSKAELKL